MGAIVVIWLLWLCSDKVCNDKNYSPLQVIYRCTSILRLWNRGLFTDVCTRLKERREILFSNMGGRIIYGLVHDPHHRRFYNCSR
jgi:hypothetical protein